MTLLMSHLLNGLLNLGRSIQNDPFELHILNNDGPDHAMWNPRNYKTKGRCCINKQDIMAYVKSVVNKEIQNKLNTLSNMSR